MYVPRKLQSCHVHVFVPVLVIGYVACAYVCMCICMYVSLCMYVQYKDRPAAHVYTF